MGCIVVDKHYQVGSKQCLPALNCVQSRVFDTHALVPAHAYRDTTGIHSLTPKAGDEAILVLSMGHVAMVAGHIVALADVLLAVGFVRL